jgi:8-oxo-dGTP diphosphatase
MRGTSLRVLATNHGTGPSDEAPPPASVPSKRREILKVGVAVTEAGRLLVVRKKGTSSYILPGGKPEKGEDDLQTLAREIEEELGCGLDIQTIVFLGSFSDTAADMIDTTVTVRLYAAKLVGSPSPRSEIETLNWYNPSGDSSGPLAPSLENQIVPFLYTLGSLRR